MQTEGIQNIGKKDVVWNYVATFFQIGAGVILLPFILKMMPSETVGVWTIFQTITSLVAMLDFGFNPSFSRNISYIFSGVTELKKNGIANISDNKEINYSLLKGTIAAMRWFYSRMAVLVFLLLMTAGTAYMYFILQSYSGCHTDAMAAWILLVLINSYNLFTLYYDSLLLGKGYIKRSKQIMIIGQCLYLAVAIVLILLGFGLISIVSAQLLSILVRRYLSHKVFFTTDLRHNLDSVAAFPRKSIIAAIYPNAIKVGLTHLGGFCVNKSAVFMGSAFLTLSQVADYGITMQVISILAGLAGVFYQSFVPKLAQYRTENNMSQLKKTYIYSAGLQVVIFCLGGAVFVLWGNWALKFIGSDTQFLPTVMLVVALFIALLEKNHALAAGFLVAKNEVPFFKASLISGAATILLLWIFLGPLHTGLWGMVLAQGIAQAAYQNWKWPLVLIKEFKK